jgi:hypothetical protein
LPAALPRIRYYDFNGIPFAHVFELGVFNCAHEPPIKVGDSEILDDWKEISPELFSSLRRRFLIGFHVRPVSTAMSAIEQLTEHFEKLTEQESQATAPIGFVKFS